MFARVLLTLHRSRALLLGAAVTALVALPATAQKTKMAKSDQSAKTSVKSKKLTWMKGPAALPPGAMMAVVSGDPSKAGPFEIELSFPNGYTVAPHSHPTAEKITVKSGEFLYGVGDEIKASEMKLLKPGNSGEMPAGMHHYAKARGKTVVAISSTGPFVINYVHAKDDPRTKLKAK
jgi:quercetin dioxygenase-like cupin family protein